MKRIYDEAYARYQIIYDELTEIENTIISAMSNEKSTSAVNPVDFDRS